ncbi:MAG: HAMP domain-containing protein [Betaproteobacteria bacterium]|jgi:class 3 adenylate cyclase|nr:HAMP domain-containing protein [Betaproteobacteria bacterium]
MRRRRIPFSTVAVTGLGLFVAVAVGVTLLVSGTTGVRTTQQLLADRAEALLDSLERQLDARLRPIDAQASWIAQSFADGRIDLSDRARLDAFMSGALGATPQVSAIAISDPTALVWRWSRRSTQASVADWSDRKPIIDWLTAGRGQKQAIWRPPLWTPTTRVAALLHDAPLRRDGKFLGMLAQIVPIERLSEDLTQFARETGVTPFVLYGEDRVLAHPLLVRDERDDPSEDPLPRLNEVGDPVLARLLAPDVVAPFGLRALTRSKAVVVRIGERQNVVITRTVGELGAQPWSVGVHLDPRRDGPSELQRVVWSLVAGFAVLIIAVIVAAFAGRRLSRPVEAFARAAKTVQEGRLEDVPTLPGSAIAEFDDAADSFNDMVAGLRRSRMIRRTLGRFVSKEVARELMKGGGKLEPLESEATVLLCDLEGFTPLTQSLGPTRVVEFLNAYFEDMVTIVERHHGVITQFQGDAILAVFNVPIADPAHAENAVRAALEMVATVESRHYAGVQAHNRVGLCTGQVVSGAVGSHGRMTYTVHGNAVNMAARLEAMNKEFGTRVLMSAYTAQQCRGVALRRLADAEVRGYDGTIELYTPAEPGALKTAAAAG